MIKFKEKVQVFSPEVQAILDTRCECGALMTFITNEDERKTKKVPYEFHCWNPDHPTPVANTVIETCPPDGRTQASYERELQRIAKKERKALLS